MLTHQTKAVTLQAIHVPAVRCSLMLPNSGQTALMETTAEVIDVTQDPQLGAKLSILRRRKANAGQFQRWLQTVSNNLEQGVTR